MKNSYHHSLVFRIGIFITGIFIAFQSQSQKLIINEIHADPASDISGDANGDGIRSASDDEFIEFVNVGAKPLDVSGWSIADTNSTYLVRHVFPASSIIPPRGALVLFGGGTPTGAFGGSVIQVASTGSLGISNSNEMFIVMNAAEDTVLMFGFDDYNIDMSATRSPDLTGSFVDHSSAEGSSGTLYSPGTKANGSPFVNDLVVINEIYADPASDITGDANGDGIRNASDDEFIELVNKSSQMVDISGWSIADTNSTFIVRHVFPSETILPAGGAIVVFGGSTPVGDFGGSIVQVASSGALGISNSNEMLILVDANSDTLSMVGIDDFGNDMSWTRSPELTGDFVEHVLVEGSGGTLFSPGTKADGTAFIFDALVINEILADPASDLPGDANGDGVRDASDDEFIEFVNKSAEPLDISGWIIADTNSTYLVRHIFPEQSIIPAGSALVVFGGGTPTGNFGGSIVQLSSTGSLGISNTNEMLIVANFEGDTIIMEGYADFNTDMSWTRSPDVSGDFVAHNTASTKLFSPGTKVDGTPFGFDPNSSLVINEFHADPAGDLPGDANGDGIRGATDDEFIEFVNKGTGDLDISGWSVSDVFTTPTVRHVFPENTVIPSGGALVLFGGGTPAGTFGNSIVQTASGGELALTNGGDTIIVTNMAGDTVIFLDYLEAGIDMSLTLDPDITGEVFVAHDTATNSGGALFSPGTKIDGSFFIEPDKTIVQLSAVSAISKEGEGPVEVEVSIIAPSLGSATTVDLVLIAGLATQIENYTTQTITFPAGSADPQTVSISITDDSDIEPSDTLYFELQNLAGGSNAELGAITQFELVIVDNDFATSTLIINEFLAWPAGQDADAGSDPTVDANGDGGIDIAEDEFIEFVNSGNADLDISGWKVYDEVTSSDPLRHVFPEGTVINPGGALILFGGGNPTGEFGGTPWQVASIVSSQLLGMTNSGDAIIIKNSNDETVIELAYGQQKRSTSVTLNPDITGALGPHPVLEGRNISPGTKVDGSPFAIPTKTEVRFQNASGGLSENSGSDYSIVLEIVRASETEATTAEVIITSTGYESDLTFSTQTVTFPAGSSEPQSVTVSAIDDSDAEGDELYLFSIGTVSGGTSAAKGSPSTFELSIVDDDVPLVFNEIHADPASSVAGDANADGISDASGDEFIEIANISDASIDMSGWEFHDGAAVRHIFESGTILAPGKAVVVFGGGIPVGEFGGSDVQISSEGGLNLDDTGETLTIFNSTSSIAARTTYGSSAGDNQSLTKSPDYTGGFVKHSAASGSGGALFSPGTKVDGSAFTGTGPLELSSALAIRLYPNPVSKEFRLSLPKNVSRAVLSLYDLKGSCMIENLTIQTGQPIDITTYEEGVYLYKIKSFSGKMLKQGKVIFSK